MKKQKAQLNQVEKGQDLDGSFKINRDKKKATFVEDHKFGDSFSDSAIRAQFVRKVYLILSVQLGFTAMFNIPFLALDGVQEFVYKYPWIVFLTIPLFVIPYFTLVCCEVTRRTFPTNMIFLLLMTLGLSCVAGYVTAKLNTEVVFYALTLTSLVTLSVTTLAVFCPFDFMSCQMVMCVVLIVVIIFSTIASVVIIYSNSSLINLIFAGVCVVLFSLFLLFDTQAIVGGRRVQIRPEEYTLAAIQIYVDLVEIFLNFFELWDACKEIE